VVKFFDRSYTRIGMRINDTLDDLQPSADSYFSDEFENVDEDNLYQGN